MKTVSLTLLLVILLVNQSEQAPNNQLKISIYYESFCPYCMEFITDQLYPGYKKIGSSLLLDFVPYGNAMRHKVNGKWVFKCQHGPDECVINKIEACGLGRTQSQDAQIEYVNCIEMQTESLKMDLKTIAKCANVLGLSANTILQCAQGPEGNDLLAKLADQQEALVPTVQYVPWLIFNDQPHDPKLEEQAAENFLKTACELLSNKPDGCSDFKKMPSR